LRRLCRPLVAAVAFAASGALAQEADFPGYTMLDLDEVERTHAASVLAVVDGFLGPIEAPLPQRLVSLVVDGDGSALTVEVEVRGYLDDSIAGENFRARLVPEGDGWRLVALGRQVVCRRGPNAGEPAEICP